MTKANKQRPMSEVSDQTRTGRASDRACAVTCDVRLEQRERHLDTSGARLHVNQGFDVMEFAQRHGGLWERTDKGADQVFWMFFDSAACGFCGEDR